MHHEKVMEIGPCHAAPVVLDSRAFPARIKFHLHNRRNSYINVLQPVGNVFPNHQLIGLEKRRALQQVARNVTFHFDAFVARHAMVFLSSDLFSPHATHQRLRDNFYFRVSAKSVEDANDFLFARLFHYIIIHSKKRFRFRL